MKYRRIVVKVGTAVLGQNFKIADERVENLVKLISEINNQAEVILVSSGAVAAGYTEIQLDKNDIINSQVLAAIGQPLLLKRYKRLFDNHNQIVAQVLMTAANFDSKRQSKNASLMIDRLLENKVIPIINENDTIAIDELVLGDNDQLSAYVTQCFDADILIILSDIDGYYDHNPTTNPDAKIYKRLKHISDNELSQEYTPNNKFATGGIVTKLKAASYLIDNNKKMFLTSGYDLSVAKSFLFDNVQKGGTLFG